MMDDELWMMNILNWRCGVLQTARDGAQKRLNQDWDNLGLIKI
jgi:hypothetical protein